MKHNHQQQNHSHDFLHLGNLLAEHDHANDHGPLVNIGGITLFQTDGLGEVVNEIMHDHFGHDHC